MTSFKYTAATLALLLASGMSYAATSTTTPPAAQTDQSAKQNGPECPAAGTVAEADLPADCKNQAAMPQDKSTTGAAETVQPKQDDAAATTEPAVQPESTTATTTTEIPKQDGTAATADPAAPPESTTATTTTEPAVQPESNTATTTIEPAVQPESNTATTTTEPAVQPESNTAATTTEMPKQDNAAAPAVTDEAAIAEASNSSSVLASQFMGQTVYSASNENVGEINDIVMSRDLNNIVAIIGVGGFLGIGEKDVAMPIDEIQVAKDENNNLKLTIAATKEQLEAAPTFDRTALK